MDDCQWCNGTGIRWFHRCEMCGGSGEHSGAGPILENRSGIEFIEDDSVDFEMDDE